MVIGRRAQSAQRIAKGELAVGRLQLAEEPLGQNCLISHLISHISHQQTQSN
jgi:hypothetical protein